MSLRTRAVLGLTALAAMTALAACNGGSDVSAHPTPAPPPKGITAPAQVIRDVPYAFVSPAEKLDLYLPARTGLAIPLVINIHGGGFSTGDKREETYNVAQLNAAGYAVASINYRLSTEATFPAAVRDAKASVRWLRSHATVFGLDPGRFAAWGTSAGGNLAAMIGTTGGVTTPLDDPAVGDPKVSAAVQAVVDWYGPSDFLTMDAQAKDPGGCPGMPEQHDPATSSESKYIGAAIQSSPHLSDLAGPISHLTEGKDIPPFYLVSGDQDCTVPYGQSIELQQALQAQNIPVTFVLVTGAGHADPKIAQTQTGPAITFLNHALDR